MDHEHPTQALHQQDGVEMPAPTAAPLVLSVGLTLLAAGIATSPAILIVGVVLCVIALGLWVGQLLPGRGHLHEHFAEPAQRRQAIQGAVAAVEQLQPGMPGYRLRLPEKVHPISAGVKGGIVGGLVMPAPALAYGLASGHGIWYPLNLLAGMVLPGIGHLPTAELEQFYLSYFILGIVIHVTMSIFIGMIYGVLLPTLPEIPRPLAWGGLLMPLFWTALSFSLMAAVNPLLYRGVHWPWFIFSQFIFGVAAALVVMRAEHLPRVRAGLLGGIVGGLLMPVPAVLWGLLSGNGIWYPINLSAGMVVSGMTAMPTEELQEFHASWLIAAICIHAAISVGFGLVYGLLLDRVPPIPGPLAWGGMLMPLLWSGASYGLMGVVNPLLQERVNWPWFVVSQFVFGVVSAIVVLRSELVHIPPAGQGQDKVSTFIMGSGERRA